MQYYLSLCDPMDCGLPSSSLRGFSRKEYWSGWPFPSPGDLPHPGAEPTSLNLFHWQEGSLQLVPPGCMESEPARGQNLSGLTVHTLLSSGSVDLNQEEGSQDLGGRVSTTVCVLISSLILKRLNFRDLVTFGPAHSQYLECSSCLHLCS